MDVPHSSGLKDSTLLKVALTLSVLVRQQMAGEGMVGDNLSPLRDPQSFG